MLWNKKNRQGLKKVKLYLSPMWSWRLLFPIHWELCSGVNFGDSRFPGSWSLCLQLKVSKVTSSVRQTPKKGRDGAEAHPASSLPQLGRDTFPPARAITGPQLVKRAGTHSPPPRRPWARGGELSAPLCHSFPILGGSPQSTALVLLEALARGGNISLVTR